MGSKKETKSKCRTNQQLNITPWAKMTCIRWLSGNRQEDLKSSCSVTISLFCWTFFIWFKMSKLVCLVCHHIRIYTLVINVCRGSNGQTGKMVSSKFLAKRQLRSRMICRCDVLAAERPEQNTQRSRCELGTTVGRDGCRYAKRSNSRFHKHIRYRFS